METITFYSYKGGVGRSLAVANAARYLALSNKKVAVLDLDLEAPGLHYKFSNNENGDPIDIQIGIVDYIYEYLTNSEQAPPSLKQIMIPLDVHGTHNKIQFIPAGSSTSAVYWNKLSHINWNELLRIPNEEGISKGIELFIDLKSRIERFGFDFLLIDSRTGIGEISEFAVNILADKLVCMVVDNKESIDVSRLMLRKFYDIQCELNKRNINAPHSKIQCDLVLSRFPTGKYKDEDEKLRITTIKKLFEDEDSGHFEKKQYISNAYIIHTDTELEFQEALRIGNPRFDENNSLLLKEYNSIFSTLLPISRNI